MDGDAGCWIVVIAHGDLGEAMVRAAEMILGPQPGLVAIPLGPDDRPEDLRERLTAVLQRAGDRPAILLVDLLGGTPFNVAARQLEGGRVACITGVNLPMLLDLLMAREEGLSPADLAARAVGAGREGIRNVGEALSRPPANAGNS